MLTVTPTLACSVVSSHSTKRMKANRISAGAPHQLQLVTLEG
ncbi:hypothetical protein AS9A_P10011 (plasmid) [Hoyosella subflava DQS3-9A1]|uniref:Uncharacterized protein n=1 Tax=Hoyosella subflava (strain DSM 45089 / JCM 17490 / NBRC 109087 / DQS3-9A1) TaxID=443218 RepID=F6ESA7_HOYSD|nr:hypothetical protein AS9A_P10011 [Hoyosella subflava DQS3-9A1]